MKKKFRDKLYDNCTIRDLSDGDIEWKIVCAETSEPACRKIRGS